MTTEGLSRPESRSTFRVNGTGRQNNSVKARIDRVLDAGAQIADTGDRTDMQAMVEGKTGTAALLA